MSQANIEEVKERVNELVKKAEELKKTASELHEKLRDSELARRVEKLAEINDTLAYFILKKAPEFGVYLHDPVGDSIGVLVKRLSFEKVIYVPRSTDIISIYKQFFDDQSILSDLVHDLVVAMINVAESVKRDVDLLAKISELEWQIKLVNQDIEDIQKKLEDP
jgi:regulator of replication initiation timing